MSRNFSVLLVEDDDQLRICLTDVLQARGLRVFPAGSGFEAMELVRARPLDFSLLDLHLPGMTGLELLQILSQEGRLLPSIMMSGEASREEASLAMRQGVFRFLHKPLDLDRLRESMDQLIRHHFGSP